MFLHNSTPPGWIWLNTIKCKWIQCNTKESLLPNFWKEPTKILRLLVLNLLLQHLTAILRKIIISIIWEELNFLRSLDYPTSQPLSQSIIHFLKKSVYSINKFWITTKTVSNNWKTCKRFLLTPTKTTTTPTKQINSSTKKEEETSFDIRTKPQNKSSQSKFNPT